MVENKERLLFYQFQMSSLGVENYFCFFHRKSLSLSLSLRNNCVLFSLCSRSFWLLLSGQLFFTNWKTDDVLRCVGKIWSKADAIDTTLCFLSFLSPWYSNAKHSTVHWQHSKDYVSWTTQWLFLLFCKTQHCQQAKDPDTERPGRRQHNLVAASLCLPFVETVGPTCCHSSYFSRVWHT